MSKHKIIFSFIDCFVLLCSCIFLSFAFKIKCTSFIQYTYISEIISNHLTLQSQKRKNKEEKKKNRASYESNNAKI